MFGAILMATNSSFQKGMIFCRSIYVKKVMKPLAFIFEQPSYQTVGVTGIKECMFISFILKLMDTNITLGQILCERSII